MQTGFQTAQRNLLGFAPMKADRLGNIVEFIPGDVLELLAFGGQPLVDLDDFLGHHVMGLRRAADEKEVWPRRQPLMAIGVKPKAQHYRFAGSLLFAWFSHKEKLVSVRASVNHQVVKAVSLPTQPRSISETALSDPGLLVVGRCVPDPV